MLFFRQYQHLLPRARAWSLTASKSLRRFFEGLAGAPSDARDFIDDVYDDMDPELTRELATWERQFGLAGTSTEEDRRRALAAAWQALGGQDPRYLQGVMQAAGFDVYVHEWWSSGPPWVARDPRSYTTQPLIGTARCGMPSVRCGVRAARCNRLLANEPGYLVNRNLTNVAPPPVPSDPDRWPYFLYWCGPTFGEPAPIAASRRAEFEQLLLKICPAQQWLVTIVSYVPDDELLLMVDGNYVVINGDFITVPAP